jgi:hypothetical protein
MSCPVGRRLLLGAVQSATIEIAAMSSVSYELSSALPVYSCVPFTSLLVRGPTFTTEVAIFVKVESADY